MEKVFYILVIVFAVLFAISLIGAAIFALIGTPKKNNSIENKHRIAKKKANICALVALGSLVLGVLCIFLNDYLIKKARIDSVNSALFGNGESESVSTSFSSDEPSESTSSAQSSTSTISSTQSGTENESSADDEIEHLKLLGDLEVELNNLAEPFVPSQPLLDYEGKTQEDYYIEGYKSLGTVIFENRTEDNLYCLIIDEGNGRAFVFNKLPVCENKVAESAYAYVSASNIYEDSFTLLFKDYDKVFFRIKNNSFEDICAICYNKISDAWIPLGDITWFDSECEMIYYQERLQQYSQILNNGEDLGSFDAHVIKWIVDDIAEGQNDETLLHSQQVIHEYLDKIDNGIAVTTEGTSQCVKDIERILAYAGDLNDEAAESDSSTQSSTVAESSEQSSVSSDSTSAVSSEPIDFPVTKTNKVSEMLLNGEPIIDMAKRDLINNYEYILDVAYVVDESSDEIKIAVQVPSRTDIETVKKAGDKAARYLASLANYANSDFALPGADDLGGLFEKYNLLLYIDDGYGNIDKYGAKVNFSPVITW